MGGKSSSCGNIFISRSWERTEEEGKALLNRKQRFSWPTSSPIPIPSRFAPLTLVYNLSEAHFHYMHILIPDYDATTLTYFTQFHYKPRPDQVGHQSRLLFPISSSPSSTRSFCLLFILHLPACSVWPRNSSLLNQPEIHSVYTINFLSISTLDYCDYYSP